ncbi:MAG: Chromate resistance exported protein [Planctomycetaceae bacterium]|nr:Chromate resistance exported protein [Planctomycetaceae bacterium]
MRWVTWENVGIDRIGCAWLILRDIDPLAEFVFIPRGAALPRDAEPFDIPGVRFSHHGGHCSFHALVEYHKLTDPILLRIARIIDEADTVQIVKLEPSACGLDLICEGLRLISPDDQSAIESGKIVYDAVYARLLQESR